MINDIIQLITSHRSVRSFQPKPLPSGLVDTLKEAMRRGPTSSALQTYTIVLVDDSDLKRALKQHAGGQDFMESCALMIVACADLRRVQNVTHERAYPYRAHDLRTLLAAVEDLTIALQNASLTAQSFGLGTVMVGGVLNGTKEISALLRLPSRVVPILGLCLGYATPEYETVLPRPRLPKPIVFHHNQHNLLESEEATLLQIHDQEIRDLDYYRDRRIPFTAVYTDVQDDPVPAEAYGWTEHVARKQAREWWLHATPKLFRDLTDLGLNLNPPQQSPELSGAERSTT